MNDAFSFDGRTAEFSLDFATPAPLGGYVEISADGARLLAQVVERRAEGTDAARSVAGVLQIIGRIEDDGTITRGADAFPSGTVAAAAPAVIQQHLDAAWPGDATLDIAAPTASCASAVRLTSRCTAWRCGWICKAPPSCERTCVPWRCKRVPCACPSARRFWWESIPPVRLGTRL